jgi:hypothetical protein
MNLTAEQFVDIAMNRQSHSFAGVVTLKEEKVLKKHRVTREPVTDTVTSRTTFNPAVGLTYSKSVNNRLAKEGKAENFVAQKLPWGEWVGTGSTIIQHKGQFYLRLSLVGANSTKKQWFLNGQPVNRADIADILPAPKKPSTNDNQGLENPIIVVNVKVDTIERLAIDGEEYRIVSEKTETPALRAPWEAKQPVAV